MPRGASKRVRPADDDTVDGGSDAPPHAAPALAAAVPISKSIHQLFRGVVKVFTTSVKPDYAQPWCMRPPSRSTSSGFVVAVPAVGAAPAQRYILTNAHSVAYHTLVQVRCCEAIAARVQSSTCASDPHASHAIHQPNVRSTCLMCDCSVHSHSSQVRLHGASEKVTARVLAVAHDCDVAVLTVDDAKWWAGTLTLKLGGLPQLHESIVVVGYPLGGDQISVTAGVLCVLMLGEGWGGGGAVRPSVVRVVRWPVFESPSLAPPHAHRSRVDFGSYAHSTREHLVLQTDSAINSGNSGGPAFRADDGTVIGIAFQSMAGSGEAEGIGYVIPTPVVEHGERAEQR